MATNVKNYEGVTTTNNLKGVDVNQTTHGAQLPAGKAQVWLNERISKYVNRPLGKTSLTNNF